MTSNSGLSPRQTRNFKLLLLFSASLLLVGFFSPMLTMSKFYLFESSFSIMGGILSLLADGQILVGLTVLAFSVVLPVCKLVFLYLAVQAVASEGELGVRSRRYLQLIHDYGRWAMLDVMVVAILIVTVKLGAVASIKVHWGLYVFAVAVFLTMFLTQRIVRLNDAP